ncbi:F-box/RNI-like superfamily protein [Striga asiatica]|uniref:F-box/RNI-like superfamily protein n=1 Tax=Striga asiatica TaxID=4170 RepID=A0A5A7R994_STRAF|nr:F-box/RNI-like superfamily protein [Striga asiatica]
MAPQRINSPQPRLFEILFNTTQQNFVSVNSSPTNLESTENLFNSTPQDFVSIVNQTLQGYLDQNLSIHKLRLDLCRPVSRPVIFLLDKWIPIITALNIKAFEFNFYSSTLPYYDLPSAVFLAESLEEIHLCKCRLSPVESVRFKSLRKLTLKQVQVDGGTLDTKMLGCPLLRCLVLKRCWKLRNVRVSEEASPGLKHFVFSHIALEKCGHEKLIRTPLFEYHVSCVLLNKFSEELRLGSVDPMQQLTDTNSSSVSSNHSSKNSRLGRFNPMWCHFLESRKVLTASFWEMKHT